MSPDFVAERNAILARGDIDDVARLFLRHNPGALPSREIIEIGMHKARTGAVGLPMADRLASHQWLVDRGYSSWLDGEPS